jgi:hypothetical protein
MRLIRLLGAVVIFYGLSYLLHALGQLFTLIRFGSSGTLLRPVMILNILIGAVTTFNGFGLLLAQKWSRVPWLITITLLVLIHNLILLMWYLSGQSLTGQILNLVLTFFLAVISWIKLSDESTKKLFR